jgi:enoyl reductase-like protein
MKLKYILFESLLHRHDLVAAIKYKNKIYTGKIHAMAFMELEKEHSNVNFDEIKEEDMGFWDKKHKKFLSREEAANAIGLHGHALDAATSISSRKNLDTSSPDSSL